MTLSRLLSWSHFVSLLSLKDSLQREYYAQMCCPERWSVRTLRGRIDSMLFERAALSRQPEALVAQELATMQDAQRMSPSLVMRGVPLRRAVTREQDTSLKVPVTLSYVRGVCYLVCDETGGETPRKCTNLSQPRFRLARAGCAVVFGELRLFSKTISQG